MCFFSRSGYRPFINLPPSLGNLLLDITLCSIWYQEYSFPRLFVPWNIRSHDGTFVLGTIRSLEHSFPGPFVPWNFRVYSEARLRRHQRKTYQRLQGRLAAVWSAYAAGQLTTSALLRKCSARVYGICSGVARLFLAVRAYTVWRPNRGDWQFTFRWFYS